MISRRTTLVALGLVAAMAFPRIALAESHHLTQAIAELKEGIHEGKQHMFSSFTNHVHNAYDHASAARQHHDPKGHIKVAMDHMRMAMKVAKRTHHERRLAAGVSHAETALIHLKAANN